MNFGLEQYLMVSMLLFSIGLVGVIVRRNLLVIYMCLELMLNAANLAFVSISRFTNHLDGQIGVVDSLFIDKMFKKPWNFCPE